MTWCANQFGNLDLCRHAWPHYQSVWQLWILWIVWILWCAGTRYHHCHHFHDDFKHTHRDGGTSVLGWGGLPGNVSSSKTASRKHTGLKDTKNTRSILEVLRAHFQIFQIFQIFQNRSLGSVSVLVGILRVSWANKNVASSFDMLQHATATSTHRPIMTNLQVVCR